MTCISNRFMIKYHYAIFWEKKTNKFFSTWHSIVLLNFKEQTQL